MWEQLQSTQPFQSVVMSCTGHMTVVWLTKYRDIVQELGVARLEHYLSVFCPRLKSQRPEKLSRKQKGKE